MENIRIIERTPTAEEFIELRHSVGWGYNDKNAVSTGLINSLFSVCAIKDNELIGFGRLIGDGGLAFYIQDIIVKPDYQNMGIGQKIVNEILNYIKQNYAGDSMVCLMAAKGKEAFYKKFGFIERPNEQYGAGMILYI